jgi:hypothetical protein
MQVQCTNKKNFLLVHWENWPEPHLYRIRKFAIGGPQKQEIVKFGPPFLVDIDRETFIIFKEYGLKNFFPPPPPPRTYF